MAGRSGQATIDGVAPFALVQFGAFGGGVVSEFGYAFRNGRWFLPYANGVNDRSADPFTQRMTLTTRTDPRPPAVFDGTIPADPERYAVIRDTFRTFGDPDRLLAIYDRKDDHFLFYHAELPWPPPWTVRGLDFDGPGMIAHITDAALPGDRLINDLRLPPGGGSLTLTHTMVVNIHGPGNAPYPDAPYRIALGHRTVRTLELAGGDDAVTTGAGFVRQIATGGGDDTVTVRPGAGVQLIDLGPGANTLRVGPVQVGRVAAEGGNDVLVGGAGARLGAVNLGGGADRVTLTGDARIESLRLSGAAVLRLSDASVIETAVLDGASLDARLTGTARILTLRTAGGDHRIATAEGYLETYVNAGGVSALAIGAGGAGTVSVSGEGRLGLTAAGFVGTVQVSGPARAVLDFAAGVDQVRTGSGADRVTTGGAAFVGTLRTGEGDEVVTLGPGGAQFVDLGPGDDVLHLAPADGIVLIAAGGAGADTADFARAAGGVAIDLGLGGAAQAVGGGQVALTGFEHLAGTTRGDRLSGDGADNRLAGRAGHDRLSGGDGADTLAGGQGRDTLEGGTGPDLFLFARGDGTDRIVDFEPGLDRIALAGVTALAQIAFRAVEGGTRIAANGIVVFVDGIDPETLSDPGNFLF